MSGSLKQFKRWYKDSGNAWSFQLGATNEAKFEVAWRAALKWIQGEYMKAREGRDIRFDLGLWDLLKKELGEEKIKSHVLRKTSERPLH